MTNTKIHCLNREDDEFPLLLSEISSVPNPLYARGQLSALNARLPLAIVGTRQMTEYGAQVLHRIIPQLVQAGVCIVSGLAYGVDALAHQIALEHDGVCIAVIASGVDVPFPSGNRPLSEKILKQGGVLVSEYPPGTEPKKQFFPARNRIISGLSKATLVIEAGEKSGALITAKFALEQNRDVFAVPGSIFRPESMGTNALIASGAYPICSAEDLLQHLQVDSESAGKLPLELSFENELEKQIFELLREPRSLDDLSSSVKVPLSVVSQHISSLELNGMIRNLGRMRYVRI